MPLAGAKEPATATVVLQIRRFEQNMRYVPQSDLLEILIAYAPASSRQSLSVCPGATADLRTAGKLDPKPTPAPLPPRRPHVPSVVLAKKNKRRR